MGLESGDYLSDLNTANPSATDQKSQGDDHLRLIKATAKKTFAGFTGAVVVTGTVGGTADAITITPATALVSYVAPMLLVFEPGAANTGAVTVNVSGLGAKNLKTSADAALSAGDLVSGLPVLAAYDGAAFRLLHVTKRYVDNTMNAVVQAYVDATAFATALPSQATNDGKFVTTDGSTASWYDLWATVAEIRAGTSSVKAINPDKLADASNFTTLTDGATVNIDLAVDGPCVRVVAGGNRTIAEPTNPYDGAVLVFAHVQDGTGSRTPSFNAVFDFGENGTPTPSTGASKADFYVFIYSSSLAKWRLIGFSKSA